MATRWISHRAPYPYKQSERHGALENGARIPYGRLLTILPAALFLCLQTVFYPATIGIKDESEYLSTAYILRAGTLFADVAHVSLFTSVTHAAHISPFYPPGEGLLLAPLTFLGWRAVFAVGILLHLVGYLVFGRLLEREGIGRHWALLYLLFPPFVLLSRTLMTEVPSATFVLIALILYTRSERGRMAAGAILGLLLFLRFANLVPLGLFLVCAAIRDARTFHFHGPIRIQARSFRSRTSWTVPFLLGCLPGIMLFGLYSRVAYGGVVGPPYRNSPGFALHYFAPHLGFYVVELCVVFPLMLVAPIFYRGRLRLEVVVICFGTLFVMSSWYFIDNGHGLAESVVTSQRLLLPVAPLWLLAYADALRTASTALRIPSHLVTTAVAGLGLVVAAGIIVVHQRHLNEAANVQKLIYRTVPSDAPLILNGESTKFVTPAWGNRRYRVVPPKPAQPICGDEISRSWIVYTARRGTAASDATVATEVAADLGEVKVVSAVGEWLVTAWRPGAC